MLLQSGGNPMDFPTYSWYAESWSDSVIWRNENLRVWLTLDNILSARDIWWISRWAGILVIHVGQITGLHFLISM